MIDILTEIENRTAYYLNTDYSDPLYDQFAVSADTAVLIMPELWFRLSYKKAPEKLKGYSISGIFDLGEIYSPSTPLRFSLYLLTKQCSNSVKTSIFNGSIKAEKNTKLTKSNDVCYLALPSSYPDAFYYYIDALESWINDGQNPQDSFFASYNEVPFSAVDFTELSALRYSKNNEMLRQKLAAEEVKTISEMADVFEPAVNFVEDRKGTFLWDLDEFQYPLRKDYFNVGKPTLFVLKKGDILLCSSSLSYQINYVPDELDGDVFCPAQTIVIRAKPGISSDYLFLYLKSNIGRSLIEPKIFGTVFQYISKKGIENLPVIVPKRPASQYRKMFETLFLSQKQLNVFSEYYEHQKADTIEDILNEELFNKALICRSKLVREMIVSDLKEIQACFEAKAYKATLILAGSVLEAFLIDWLSELEGKDYFSDTIRSNYDNREADLCEIINRIKAIKRPKWMSEADKAHKIRKKRNLVHAKLCLNENMGIDDNLCKQVIQYLKEIIETRYGKR